MKTKIKHLRQLLILVSLITFIGCSEDIYDNHDHDKQINKNSISFNQFKRETGIKNFEALKSIQLASENSRTIETEFLTDTTSILKYTSVNNKVTYSFKIYPIFEALESKEYYNLVFEKYGTDWNEIIFLNKERDIQEIGESKLESSEMVYNERMSAISMGGFCEVINYTVQCDGSCNGECDGFACPTGQCIHESISYVYCGNSGGIEAQPLIIDVGPSNNGGGNDYSGIFIPNPYDGEADLNNPDFVFATQVAAFTRTLPTNLKNLMTNNFWIYPNIVDFMRDNGGITQQNKDSVIFALTNSIPIFNLNLPNWTFTEINQLNFDTFIFLLQNPNTYGSNFIQHVVNYSNSIGEVDFNYRIILDNSIKNDPCLSAVYTQLGKAPTFQNYLQNFDGNFSVANLKLSVGVDPNYPTANAVTSAPQNYLITIMFNPNNLNRPSMDIARTFVHEIIHAEIFRKLLSCANLPNLNINNYSDSQWQNYITNMRNNFPGLFDYYMRYKYNIPAGEQPSNAQHQLMAQHYREIIAQALREYDNNSHPDELYSALAWTGLMGEGDIDATTGLPTNPTSAWQNLSQNQRLQILSISNNFVTTETPCQ